MITMARMGDAQALVSLKLKADKGNARAQLELAKIQGPGQETSQKDDKGKPQ